MKSGNFDFTFKIDIGPEYYRDHHADVACKGKFKLKVVENGFIAIDALGPIQVPAIPMATCSKCGASYIMPKFKQFIEWSIANYLITSKSSLSKKQVRFLRLFLDETQEEFAHHIGVSDRHEMCKIESDSIERGLDSDKQVRLRLHCAKHFGAMDREVILNFNEIDDSKQAQITPAIFSAVRWEDFQQKFG